MIVEENNKKNKNIHIWTVSEEVFIMRF